MDGQIFCDKNNVVLDILKKFVKFQFENLFGTQAKFEPFFWNIMPKKSNVLKLVADKNQC